MPTDADAAPRQELMETDDTGSGGGGGGNNSMVVVSEGLAASLTKAEIDQQIATAKKYPRSIKRAIENLRDMVLLDEETASSCMFSLPRAGKVIEGPSVRFAESLQQAWGNNRAAARVTHVDQTFVEAVGVYHDLETNVARSASIRRRITGKNKRRYDEDMIIVTGNAASAIAIRNAILAGIPRPVWGKVYTEVRQMTLGNVQTLANRRAAAIAAFQRYGVLPEQIFQALGVAGEIEIGLEHLLGLRGALSAIINEEATPEELFPPVQPAGGAKVITSGFGDAGKTKAGATTRTLTPETVENGERLAAGEVVDGQKVDPATGEVVDAASLSAASNEGAKSDTPPAESTTATTKPAAEEAAKRPTKAEKEAAAAAETEARKARGAAAEQRGREAGYAGREKIAPDGLSDEETSYWNNGWEEGKAELEAQPEATTETADTETAVDTSEAQEDEPEPADTAAIFAAYRRELEAADTWNDINQAALRVIRLPEVKDDEILKVTARRAAWARFLVLRESGLDKTDIADSVSLFRVWLETEEAMNDPDAITGVWRMVARSPDYLALSADQPDGTPGGKTTLANIVKDKIVAAKAGKGS